MFLYLGIIESNLPTHTATIITLVLIFLHNSYDKAENSIFTIFSMPYIHLNFHEYFLTMTYWEFVKLSLPKQAPRSYRILGSCQSRTVKRREFFYKSSNRLNWFLSMLFFFFCSAIFLLVSIFRSFFSFSFCSSIFCRFLT